MTGLIQLRLIIGGIVLLALGGAAWFIDSNGFTRGVRETQIAYATAKPKIDTVRTVEYVDRPKYRDRMVPFYIRDPRADSLIAVQADKDSLIRVLSEKASQTFGSPDLGILKIDYSPLDRLFEIDHQPPPAKIERIQITVEKPVLVRENFWQKVDEYLIAGAVGGVIAILVE